jgi:hypothetical protein
MRAIMGESGGFVKRAGFPRRLFGSPFLWGDAFLERIEVLADFSALTYNTDCPKKAFGSLNEGGMVVQ